MTAVVAQASWAWIPEHADEILQRTLQHLQLTFIPVGIGLVISLVLAVVAIRNERLYGPITRTTGVLYTIPSVALFPLLLPYTGLGTDTAVIVLTAYTLLILVRNIVAGLEGVPDDVLEAAEGMGYAPARRFLEIDLPLALPVIIAGIRITVVTTIGLVTITGLIGLGGLGFFIFSGFTSNFFIPELTVGAVGPLLLALAFDGLLNGLERLLTPWSRRAAA